MQTLSRDQLSFRISRAKLDKAQALASSLGIELEVNEIDPIGLALTLYEVQERHIAPRYELLPESFKSWAAHLVAGHVEIVAHAPVSEWAVVALVDRSEGSPLFHAIDPTVEYWTTERMDGIDFSRCDECGVRNHRNRAFIIRKGEVVRQIGGSCAKHLDLTKKIRDLIDGFQSFADELRNGDDDEWCGGFGGSSALNLPLAVMLAEEVIALEGYMSAKAAEKFYPPCNTTSMTCTAMLCPPKGEEGRKVRDNDQWREANRRWIAGEADAVMAEVQAWLDASTDDQFHRNIRAAIQNESWKHLGLIVFAVAEIRNWRLAIKQKEKGVDPKCYEHVETAPEAVAEACGMTLQALGALIGHDCAGKLKAPARKALLKVLPGVWTLIGRASWEGQFGWQDMVQFQRADGARVKWMTGSLDSDVKWIKGEEYLILSASLGDDLGTHEKYGIQGRRISRAFIRPVKAENMSRPLCVEVDDAE